MVSLRQVCKSCKSTKEVMAPHLHNFGFMKDYSKWTFHSETCRMRSEAMRQHIREFDGDARVADMIDDFHETHFQGERLWRSQSQERRRIMAC
jgi:hypothetical protein